mmetsp:Transcript_44278/g.128033  ORF Transcript_44278/g.128033 Transcript_44278/m.128033 type:complete len:309 (-) Transcript_44278:21-947(-)
MALAAAPARRVERSDARRRPAATRSPHPAAVGRGGPRLRPRSLLPQLLLAQLAVPTCAIITELYTTNAACAQKYCVNPAFPAVDQLPSMENMRWRKQSLASVSQFMSFCGQVLSYDPAVPVFDSADRDAAERRQQLENRTAQGLLVTDSEVTAPMDALKEAVARFDRQAATRYFVHLAGMGIEAWDHTDPMEVSAHPLRPCAKSVARLICFTHFPQAPSQLAAGEEVKYLRPCKNSCESYLQTCGVECCDEGLSCVWGEGAANATDSAAAQRRARTVRTTGPDGKAILLAQGYADHDGPSAFCTGDSM